MIGGSTAGGAVSRVFQYDVTANRFGELPSMKEARFDHSCGAVKIGQVVTQVVVVSGDSTDAGVSKSIETYDVLHGIWTKKDGALKSPIRLSASVQHGRSFFLVGGRVGGTPSKSVFEYDPEKEELEVSPKLELEMGTSSLVAVPIDNYCEEACEAAEPAPTPAPGSH